MIALEGRGVVCDCCALMIANADESGCRDFHGHAHPSCKLPASTVLGEDRAVEYGEDTCAGCGQALGRLAPVHEFSILLAESDFDAFADGYVEAMLWANTVAESESSEVESALVVGETNLLTAETLESLREDCHEFLADVLSSGTVGMVCGRVDWPYVGRRATRWSPASLAGHDFALTRNHHGAGFWDRGLGDVGDKLTDLAHAYGERTLYLTADHTIITD